MPKISNDTMKFCLGKQASNPANLIRAMEVKLSTRRELEDPRARIDEYYPILEIFTGLTKYLNLLETVNIADLSIENPHRDSRLSQQSLSYRRHEIHHLHDIISEYRILLYRLHKVDL
eukprot:TRINITY_DN2234_c0_g1_i1.p1 TRINITY_DN2234_c0_g1~~TRINITY_DN2234_c0_g1_i1.p1  ORF type:complete len:118 (+),score=12.93 TRINITY_DN2234_c0_g1_i1:201-554(+)